MNAQNITIERIGEQAGVSNTGQPTTKVVVTFKVDGHGPFTETFDKGGFDPVQARAALMAFAQKLSTLHGH